MLYSRLMCAALALLSCLAALSAEEQPASKKVDSAVLEKEFMVFMEAVVADMKSKEKPPPEMTDEKIKQKLNEAAQVLKNDGLFKTTVAQEEQFKNGTFDNAANTARMQQSVKVLGELQAPFPGYVATAIEQYQTGKLNGVRLELAVRMLEAVVARAQAVVKEKK